MEYNNSLSTSNLQKTQTGEPKPASAFVTSTDGRPVMSCTAFTCLSTVYMCDDNTMCYVPSKAATHQDCLLSAMPTVSTRVSPLGF